jgi:hypothetical protein
MASSLKASKSTGPRPSPVVSPLTYRKNKNPFPWTGGVSAKWNRRLANFRAWAITRDDRSMKRARLQRDFTWVRIDAIRKIAAKRTVSRVFVFPGSQRFRDEASVVQPSASVDRGYQWWDLSQSPVSARTPNLIGED